VKNQPARRVSRVAISRVLLFPILIFVACEVMNAQPQALEDAVERLAQKAVALPHEHRMSLIWSNHSGLSEQRVEHLRALFVGQLSSAQVHIVQGEAAPALRVMIEQTPSRMVLTASVPAEGSVRVVMEEVARSLAGSEEKAATPARLEKELVWTQERKILSAALLSESGDSERQMVLLMEEALLIYSQAQGSWKLQATKRLPNPLTAERGARGQLMFAEENLQQAGILLPGRRCEANLKDESAVACVAGNPEWPAGRLLANAACGAQTWWLKSDATDWTVEDRLLLRSSGAGREAAPVAEMSVPGPVQAIGVGIDAGSASVVVRNISTGNYEVYRVGLSCAN